MNENIEAPVENTETIETPVIDFKNTKHKVKIDDETEEEYSYEDLLKFAKENKRSQNRYYEADQMKHQAEELLALAKNDPKALLTHPLIGQDLRKFANEIIAEAMEEELLNPDQKELRKTKRELDELRSLKQQQEEKANQEQEDTLRGQYEEDYSNQIVEALVEQGLPKTEYTIKRLAEYMLQAYNQGFKEVKAKDIAPLVKQDFIAEQNQIYSASDEEALLNLLGEDVIKKIVKGHLNKAKKEQKPSNQIKKDSNYVAKTDKPTKRITPEEDMERRRQEWEAKYGKNG